MKKINIIILVLFVIGAVALTLFGCRNKDEKVLGTNSDKINEEFPAIEGVESCEWTYEKLTNDSFLSVGTDQYAFYGKVVLSNEYYNKIITEYEWQEYTEEAQISFIDDIKDSKKVYSSDKYTDDVSSKTFVKLLLEKDKKTIYFYQED